MVRNMLLVFMLASLVWGRREVPFLKPNPGTFKKGNNGVCLFLTTTIEPESWSVEYSKKFIFWMRHVFLVSVKNQFKTPCRKVEVFKLLIKGKRWDPKLAELADIVKNLGGISVVWHMYREFQAVVKETVLMYNCNWISTIWLDGDDALLDGYFKYVTEEIPKMLTKTTTSEGRPWLGGVFALRSPKWLDLGLNRCRGLFEGFTWYCGYSQGQGILIRRSIWEALGMNLPYHGFHMEHLKILREWVMHGLGHGGYVSTAGVGSYKFWRDTEEMRAYEQGDAAKSQIQMFDLSKNWTTSGLFVRTPFSSHFPWKFIEMIPECTKEQIIDVARHFPQDINYIIEAWMEHPEIHMTLLEVCSNNHYVLRANKGATCENLEAEWLQEHNYPSKM